MFSTISSFFPSILQSGSVCSNDQPLQSNDDIPEQLIEPEPTISEPLPSSPKKKHKKDKQPNETFIVVRPPPSKSANPCNLQVQLVPPQSRNFSSSTTIHALDSSAPDSTDAARSSSDKSDYSGYTSATSISSFASTSTTASARRTIIPLYNLQAHHVMATTIVDAGTDAKVAKFAKRGLEIIGLAILEPIEVWGATSLPNTIPPTGSARTSVDDQQQREFGALPPRFKPGSPSKGILSLNERPLSSYSTAAHDGELRQRQQQHVISHVPTTDAATPIDAPPQRKKIFSRMFKKKDAPRPLSVTVSESHVTPAVQVTSPLPGTSTTRGAPAHDTFDTTHLHLGFGLSDSFPSTPMSAITSMPTSTSTALCPAVLGLQAMMYPPIQPPVGRPTKYVWVVRRWLKGTETGLLNGMMGKLSINGRNGGENTGVQRGLQVEVRFEWARGRKKERERDRGRRKAGEDHETGQNSENRSRNAVSGTTPSPTGRKSTPSLENRSSVISLHSANSDVATASECSVVQPHPQHRRRRRSTRAKGTSDESGDESDPEDSETPWTCTVTIQRLGVMHSSSSVQRLHPHTSTMISATSSSCSTATIDHTNTRSTHSPPPPPTSVCLKVATLSPTPHHPKVVGLLKMPFPLPDIEVEQLAIRKRIITPHGVSRTTGAGTGTLWETEAMGMDTGADMSVGSSGLVLTAEEIKDTISSTALWLVVREAFGGVGRDKRKGEGWRIRP